ncbi:lachrymatory-factor synthase-like [Hibiscus syriacus]|uniref:Lachrymatory-factor synthase-like n=1 Tax=Hibiscus syriacus TaxID=106335 RepID=A0A6A2WEU9_HIBSY|nr:lachrymatory-factor synthase-like [Hibiscus syriacus]
MATAGEMDQLTSGASNRLIPTLRTLRIPLIFIRSMILCLLVLLFPRRRHSQRGVTAAKITQRRSVSRWEKEDTLRRRALTEALDMGFVTGDGKIQCRWSTSLFFGVRGNALFCRSWFPLTGELRGILIIIHGLNGHSGRYAQFAKQLNSSNFGVHEMDWTDNDINSLAVGHSGSDGLHGYVPSLDHVVADTGDFLWKIKSENPGVPLFLFDHSTGGAVAGKSNQRIPVYRCSLLVTLLAASYPCVQEMLEGIVLTYPALHVKPAHPIFTALAPLVSLIAPKLQFKGTRYLRISSHLMRIFKSVTILFFVLHGTADKVTDPLASRDLYNKAASEFKDIKHYEGFLHDLLFEPELEEIVQDIIDWMKKRLDASVAGLK